MKKLKYFFRPNFFSLLAITFSIFAFGPFSSPQKSISVAVDKMNVFYVGVENPITVAVEGVADEKVIVTSEQAVLHKAGKGKYSVTVSKPGTVKIMVHGEGFEPQELEFRVKRVPDPISGLQLDNSTLWNKEEISAENFRQGVGLGVIMENFSYDFKAGITSYKITRVPRGQAAIELDVNTADQQSVSSAKALMGEAATGDVYYFTDVKGQFPGDVNARYLNSLVYKIK